MRPTNIGVRLRELLLANPDGMTVRELSKIDGTPQDVIMGALERNYGFYVGGWQKAFAGKYRAIWRVVVVPASAPKPMEYSEDFDKEEALRQRKLDSYKERQAELQAQRKKARLELKAQLAREKLEKQQRKAEAKALREQAKAEERAERLKRKQAMPAGGAGYVPQLTRWAPVQPWPQGATP